jgi:hypothetical protein
MVKGETKESRGEQVASSEVTVTSRNVFGASAERQVRGVREGRFADRGPQLRSSCDDFDVFVISAYQLSIVLLPVSY